MNAAALIFIVGAAFLSGFAFGCTTRASERRRLYRERLKLLRDRRRHEDEINRWDDAALDKLLDALDLKVVVLNPMALRGQLAAIVPDPEAWKHAGEN